MWDWKNAKYKDHVPNKKQKATKIEESYICLECLEVSLKGNRDEKYASLCRKDNSSIKRHKDRWHEGSNLSTCTIISSSAPEIIALRKQYKDQQPTVLDEDNEAAKTITTQEMLLETAVPVTEDDSRSDADYYHEKNTLTSSSVNRQSTYSITIADSSDKPKKNQKTLFSFKQAKSEQEPTLSDVMESINSLSIEIKKMTSRHNKMENVLNDPNQAKTLEKVKKVENINEIMEATDLIERFYDESPECGVLRCKPCFKLHEISKPHIPTLTPLPAQCTLNPSTPGTLATGTFFTKDQTRELITGENQYWHKQKNSCIDNLCLIGHCSKSHKHAM